MAATYKCGSIIVFYFVLLFYGDAIKLNVPRVLLPFSQTVSANFTLEVTDGGCYRWYVSRPEVIRITVLDDEERGCSSKAVVTSSSKVPTQQTALVTIVNDATEESLHCDVTVTSIYELEITTTTRELFLEDTPEAFTLRAKDKEGDTFSSVDGLVIDWNLITDVDTNYEIVDAEKVLRFMKFSESLYKASPAIYALEAQSLKGYTVLVQGIKTGTAKVQATLKDAAYPEPLSTEITLTVVANLILYPSYEVRLLVGSVLTYQVRLLQHGKSQSIQMPSEQFHLEITDGTIASLNPLSLEVEALAVGYTTVVLKDRNVKPKHAFRQPSAGIHVVAAHHIGFGIMPHQNWHLIKGREYAISIKLFDRDNNQILNTDNVRISAIFSEAYFDIISKTANGTYYRVIAKAVGSTQIVAKLDGILMKDYIDRAVSPLEESQDAEIVERTYILPERVILPWNPVAKPTYKMHLEAFGGGNYGYHWKSHNLSIASVNQLGDVVSKRYGIVNITAASARNSHDYGLATISILLPYSLAILSSTVEIDVGNVTYLPVALYASSEGLEKSQLAFTDCTQYPMVVDTSDSKKLEYYQNNIAPTVDGSCVMLPFRALGEGFVRVFVSFHGQEGEGKASILIGVYKPLTLISQHSIDNEVVLTVGSSVQIAFEGGPRPWSLKPQTYFRNVGIKNETVASTWMNKDADIASRDLHVFTVLCREIGETVIFLHVGNLPSTNNPMPVSVKAEIRVICALPTVIELHPLVARPAHSLYACQIDERRVSSQCYLDLEIAVTARDQEGRLFDNFTSLAFSWESSDQSLGTVTEENTLLTIENIFEGYRTLNKSYRTLYTKGVEGFVKVVARVESYHQDLLQSQEIYMDANFEPELTATLFLDLVKDAYFTQNVLSVFNHPQNNVSLSVLRGSGQFYFEPTGQSIADIHYDEKFHQFKVTPKMDGSFNLILYDACLETRQRASASIQISGIHKVEVNVVDKVGLDKQVVATVRVLDQKGLQLPDSVFDLLNIQPSPSSSIISIQPAFDSNVVKKFNKFTVMGKALGHTTFTFTVGRNLGTGQTDLVKSSDPQSIQVFSPLHLHPRNITLIIGAAFQISSSGGPHPQVNIEYSIGNAKIASVSSSGVINGLSLGATVIVGRAFGTDLETGEKIIYSQDQINVFVMPLTGIRIRVPLTRVQAGVEIPVYAVGVNDHETPFAFGSSNPALIFKWSSSNKEVAVLQTVYQKCGIHLFEANHFMMRLSAKQQGQVTLSLQVSLAIPSVNGLFQIQDDIVLSDQIQIQVFERLQLIAPPISGLDITISPNTNMKMLSNKDQNSNMHYQILHSSCRVQQEDIRVSHDGNLKSGKSLCHASLLITSTDEIGANQTLSALVSVTPVSYMLVEPICSLHASGELLTVLPVGTRTLFHVYFHDSVGKEFHATNSRLKFFTSRYDLVQIMQGPRNGTFYVKANNPGLTVLRVWDAENVGVENYLLLMTGEVILPPRPVLTLGDRICFNCILVSVDDTHGTWHSENSNVLQMITASGTGFAAGIGTSTVLYNVSGSVATSTELTVAPITAIKFQSGASGKHLTNAHLGRVVYFPLILSSDASLDTNLHGKNCTESSTLFTPPPFECALRFNINVPEDPIEDIFEVKPRFDFASGYHECTVKTIQNSRAFQQRWSPLVSELELHATVTERSKQGSISSEILRLPFHPAFYVSNVDIELDDLQPSMASLTISASEHVFAHLKVKANDTTLINVLDPVQDVAVPNVKLYPVKLSETFWKRIDEKDVPLYAELIASCTLTNQEVRVPVKIKIHGDGTGKCPADQERTGWRGLFAALAENYQNMVLVILTLIGTLIALFISYHAIMKQQYYAAAPQTGIYLNRSGEGRLYPQGSPGFNSTLSTERPHLWSVNEPVHGSPSFQRTPSPRFRTLFDT